MFNRKYLQLYQLCIFLMNFGRNKTTTIAWHFHWNMTPVLIFFLRYKNFIKNQVISLHTRDKTNSGEEAKKTSLRPDLIAKRASSVLISNLRTFLVYS